MTAYLNMCDPSNSVDPDPLPIPRDTVFRRCFAHRLCPDDLVMVGMEIYRVKTKQIDKSAPMIIFCLWPLRGGKVAVIRFAPRQQVAAVLQDTEGSTKPLPPLV